MALVFTKQEGAVLKAGDGGGTEVFTAIAGVISFNWSAATRTVIDTTDLDSADNAREFKGGIVDYGEMSFDIHYDPNNGTHDETTGIWSYFSDTAPRNFQYVFPNADTTTLEFSAITQSMSVTGSLDDKITASVVLKLTGMPTIG